MKFLIALLTLLFVFATQAPVYAKYAESMPSAPTQFSPEAAQERLRPSPHAGWVQLISNNDWNTDTLIFVIGLITTPLVIFGLIALLFNLHAIPALHSFLYPLFSALIGVGLAFIPPTPYYSAKLNHAGDKFRWLTLLVNGLTIVLVISSGLTALTDTSLLRIAFDLLVTLLSLLLVDLFLYIWAIFDANRLMFQKPLM